MSQNERVSVKEAAAILGMSEQGIKEHMKRGLFEVPIGYVTNPTGRKNQYHIYRKLLEKHMAMEKNEPQSPEGKPKSREELIGDIVLKAVQQIIQVAARAD